MEVDAGPLVNPADTKTEATAAAIVLSQYGVRRRVSVKTWDDAVANVAFELYACKRDDDYDALPARRQHHVRHVAAARLLAARGVPDNRGPR